MGSQLNYISRQEMHKLAKVLSPVVQAFGDPKSSRGAMLMAASLLLKQTDKESNEWVYWYSLGDFYQALGMLTEGVKACQKCYALQPQDPRSIYALATSYRLLTRAKYLDNPHYVAEIQSIMSRLGARGVEDINPQASKDALDSLGMAIDAAARNAYNLFQALLSFRLDRQDRNLVSSSLAAMSREFPAALSLASKEETMQKPVICPNCGANNDPISMHCVICGTSLTLIPKQPPKPRPARRYPYITGKIYGLIIIIIALVIASLTHGELSDPGELLITAAATLGVIWLIILVARRAIKR